MYVLMDLQDCNSLPSQCLAYTTRELIHVLCRRPMRPIQTRVELVIELVEVSTEVTAVIREVTHAERVWLTFYKLHCVEEAVK